MREKTFFVFKKDSSDVTGLIGPLFEVELEPTITENFEKYDSYEVLEEELFKMLYPGEYKNNLKQFWSIHLETFFSNFEFDLDFELIVQDNGYETIIGRYFSVYVEEDTVYISFNINLDPTLSSKIMLELCNYIGDQLKVEIGVPFYYSMDEEYFFGEESYIKSIAESGMNNILLN